jgi:phosphatidylglycerophosphatase A
MNFKKRLVLFLATGFNSGNIPVAPGTFGSLVALPICYIMSLVSPSVAAVTTAGMFVFAIWMAGSAEKMLNARDPGCIVIDEIIGMMITLLWLPFTLFSAVAGFILFRVFDILKPFPIRLLDRKLSGGMGIVLDDVLAGIFSHLILRVLLYTF